MLDYFLTSDKYLAEKLNDAAPEESYYSPKREPPDDGEVANDVDIDWIPNAAESDRDSGSESESAHDEDSNPLKVDNDCNSSESEKEDDTPVRRKFTPSKPGQFYCNLCLARKNTKRKKYTSLNLQDFLKHYIYHKRKYSLNIHSNPFKNPSPIITYFSPFFRIRFGLQVHRV